MDRVMKAYIVGLIDGEGSIFIERSVRKGRLSGVYTGNLRYRLMVQILMCDPEAIAFVAKATGRPIYKKKLGRNGITRRSHAYVLTWRNGVAASFLQSILPFLHGKKKQAELGIRLSARIAKPLGIQFSKKGLEVCANIHARMQALKRPYASRC
jgi:hypothetical protein